MKKTELIFNLISIVVDAIMLLLAAIASFYIRQHSIALVGPIKYQLVLGNFFTAVVNIIPAVVLIFAVLGLYNLKGTRKFGSEFGKIIVGVSLVLLLIILIYFFNQDVFPSRFIILASWALGIIFVTFGRTVLKYFQEFLFRRGLGLHRLIIINGDASSSSVIENIYKNTDYGYEIVDELVYDQLIFDTLEIFTQEKKIDEILQANPTLSDEDNLKLVQFARNKGLSFSFVPNLFEVQRNSVETYNLQGIPVIALKNTPLDGWGRVAKRVFDILASAGCLILTSPVFLIVSLAIKLDSAGRVIYWAMRGGRGKNFKFYKFRTMYSHLSVGNDYGGVSAERMRQQLWKKNDRGGERSPFLKIKDDPRVTKVGRFLRKTKLDEIPQFWNVFIGDMSMVGPRAHVLDEVEKYQNRYPRMFSIKPGIFGMSQIAQVSWPDLPFEEEIKSNISYIENWSLWLDFKILTKSFYLLLFGVRSREDY